MTIPKANVPDDFQTWINDGSPAPDWIQDQMTEITAPNGTFLLATRVGAARVHIGDVVVRYAGELWTTESEELSNFLAGLEAEMAATATAIGPGKTAQFGTRSKHRGKRGLDRKMPYRPPVGSMPSIEWVHISELRVDQSYQRSVDNEGSRRLIASIAANFDWRLCAPLVVSRRADGTKVIIDGQHRWSAAMRRGDLLQLPCCLFSYDSPEDEARMFIVANRARKPMNRMDDFHAALAAADEDALEILRLVTEAGLVLARSTSSVAWKPGEVAFTSSIATALRQHGAAVVSAALTSIAEGFSGQALIHGGSIFRALTKLFAHPPEGFDPDNVVPALLCYDMAGWSEITRPYNGGDARAAAVYSTLIEMMAALENDLTAT